MKTLDAGNPHNVLRINGLGRLNAATVLIWLLALGALLLATTAKGMTRDLSLQTHT